MPVARAPRVLVLIILCFTLIAGLAPAAVAAAGPSIPLPAKMAAVGDSITQAASSAGSLGSDAPQNSWSTGTSTTVNSHYLRLLSAGAPISGQNHNRSVSGAKMANLATQMGTLATIQPHYLTVLMGGNDLCTDTVDQMTSAANFRSQFSTAMTTLLGDGTTTGVSPNTNVYVVSIPNVYQLWNLFKGNFWARFIWSSANICQSLLANPTSTQPADVQRRADVRQRNIDYNTQLAQVCSAFPANCHFDNNAAFKTTFTTSDVSGDYFHPSVAGQAKLASVSWSAGYTWTTSPTTNNPPTASFTHTCTGLTCSFNASASSDGDGSVTGYSWDFGDGTSGSGVTTSRTYAAAGTRTVTLTVTDNGGATGSTSQSVTVTTTNNPPTASFTHTCTGLTCSFNASASSDGDGSVTGYSWDFGDGTSGSGVTTSRTYAAAGTRTVTLTVTDNGGATGSTSQSVTVSEPSSVVIRIADLSGSGSIVNRNFWRATVTVMVTDTTGATVSGATVTGTFGVGSAKSCTTGSVGTCLVTSDNLSRSTVDSVDFTVTGATHATLAYDSTKNVVTSIPIPRP